MNIHPINALAGLRTALEAPESERLDVFRREVMEPLRPFWAMFRNFGQQPLEDEQQEDVLGVARAFGYYSPELDVAAGLEALHKLEEAGSWITCVDAVRKAFAVLDPASYDVKLPDIQFTFVLGDPVMLGKNDKIQSYTGFGGMPGLIMMMAWPNAFNLPRLAAATAHEANHNVRFSVEPWTQATTVGQYMVAEGLAEAFAVELYGEDKVGPWATALSAAEIEMHKPRYREALEVTGDIRGYIFGDWIVEDFGTEPLGLPDFAGYTVGYEVVRAYLKRTGQTAAAATYVPWREIVGESEFF